MIPTSQVRFNQLNPQSRLRACWVPIGCGRWDRRRNDRHNRRICPGTRAGINRCEEGLVEEDQVVPVSAVEGVEAGFAAEIIVAAVADQAVGAVAAGDGVLRGTLPPKNS